MAGYGVALDIRPSVRILVSEVDLENLLGDFLIFNSIRLLY